MKGNKSVIFLEGWLDYCCRGFLGPRFCRNLRNDERETFLVDSYKDSRVGFERRFCDSESDPKDYAKAFLWFINNE